MNSNCSPIRAALCLTSDPLLGNPAGEHYLLRRKESPPQLQRETWNRVPRAASGMCLLPGPFKWTEAGGSPDVTNGDALWGWVTAHAESSGSGLAAPNAAAAQRAL